MPNQQQKRAQSTNQRSHKRIPSKNVMDQTFLLAQALLYNPSICNIVCKDLNITQNTQKPIRHSRKRSLKNQNSSSNANLSRRSYENTQTVNLIKQLKLQNEIATLQSQQLNKIIANQNISPNKSQALLAPFQNKHPLIHEFKMKEPSINLKYQNMIIQRPKSQIRSQRGMNQTHGLDFNKIDFSDQGQFFKYIQSKDRGATGLNSDLQSDRYEDYLRGDFQRMGMSAVPDNRFNATTQLVKNTSYDFPTQMSQQPRFSRPTTAASNYQPELIKRYSQNEDQVPFQLRQNLNEPRLIQKESSYGQHLFTDAQDTIGNNQQSMQQNTQLTQQNSIQLSLYHRQQQRPKSASYENKKFRQGQKQTGMQMPYDRNKIQTQITESHHNQGIISSDANDLKTQSIQLSNGQQLHFKPPRASKKMDSQHQVSQSQFYQDYLERGAYIQSMNHSEMITEQNILDETDTHKYMYNNRQIHPSQDHSHQSNVDLDIEVHNVDLNAKEVKQNKLVDRSIQYSERQSDMNLMINRRNSQSINKSQDVNSRRPSLRSVSNMSYNKQGTELAVAMPKIVEQSTIQTQMSDFQRLTTKIDKVIEEEQKMLQDEQLKIQQDIETAKNKKKNLMSDDYHIPQMLLRPQASLASSLSKPLPIQNKFNNSKSKVNFKIQVQSSTQDLPSTISKYSGAKKYEYLSKRLDKMRDLVEDIKYKDYLKRVEILNQKKAYLSTYRFVLGKDEKQILIKEIEEREAAVELEEKEMFLNEKE
ncbi:UNKNOWN [Stylonychia lemnae]|uniref:Uncharacterized protein n=1 Tax=Stylonychia lemnae TaxID=5949 RepID=A0A078BBE4_STYLE|nr:UNKNOWN [Stylonychia lemnae]|eukprot:CDW91719.1 UNKNOWN [Stylonychia lemnae]